MGMNDTPSGNRLHIGFFGRRNAGKSSVVNAVVNQELSVVSDVCGTTTDPVMKAMELLPLGPVLIIDTPGYDDEGELGELRIRKTKQVLNKTDVAILVVDATKNIEAADRELIEIFKAKHINYLIVYNKSDLIDVKTMRLLLAEPGSILVSAKDKKNIEQLKEQIALIADTDNKEKHLVGSLVSPGDVCLLIVPIDKAAPKGRLILPQQQVIRDLLDNNAIPVICKENEIEETLAKLSVKPKLAITDSQVFEIASKAVPDDIYLTSFSILMARYKGFLKSAVEGAITLDMLNDGDNILISEGCTHHRQCGDIGTEKLPNWIREYTGKNIDIEFSTGGDFPEDLSKYKLVVHCGGCMLGDREVLYRMKCARDFNVPFTNYGIVIAHTKGILHKSIAIFKGKYD